MHQLVAAYKDGEMGRKESDWKDGDTKTNEPSIFLLTYPSL